MIAAVILAITAMLVNAAPARSSRPRAGLADAEVEPGVGVRRHRSRHRRARTTCTSPRCPTGGGPATITDMTVQLTRPGEDLPPFTVPLQKLGAGPLLRAAVRHPVPRQVADDDPGAARRDRRERCSPARSPCAECPTSTSPPISSWSSPSSPTRWSSSRSLLRPRRAGVAAARGRRWCRGRARSRRSRWCSPGSSPP